jgi:trimeric autotransporter adhesin
VAVDGAGNLIIPDLFNNRIRVVAENSGTFYGVTMTAGDIYTVAGDGTRGFSGDGGPAIEAKLYYPGAVAVDGAGNLLVADTINDRIRVVAATSGTFYGVKMTADDIYTVAGSKSSPGFSGDGGPAVKAELGRPQGIAVDPAGNLLIGDTWNNRVRVVAVKSGTFYGIKMTANDIYTVAGNGILGFSGVGVPAVDAELDQPAGVAADSAGNLFFGGDRVLEVSG